MPRPSKHDPITKSYAIDQIDDIEHLRAMAHRMWEAFYACHSQYSHVIAALLGTNNCRECRTAFSGSAVGDPCARYEEWQKQITDGFGSV